MAGAEAKVIFIGHDGRFEDATEVCKKSLLHHSTQPLAIQRLTEPALRHAGFYRRESYMNEIGAKIDAIDKRPFSTDFAFTRFLVPALMQYAGLALFCDSDFLWREDVGSLFALFNPRFAVQVVKHEPLASVTSMKMDGRPQQPYFRKNWTSLMLFNCGHAANRYLTPWSVNGKSGQWLHSFGWLEDEQIGALPPEWNHLVGVDEPEPDPCAAHFTLGIPALKGHEADPFADEWRAHLAA